jgi:hypothetical protein
MFGSGEIFPIPELGEHVPADMERVVNIENLYVEMKKTMAKSLMVPERSQAGVRYNLQVKTVLLTNVGLELRHRRQFIPEDASVQKVP